ncbi:hypothetical protein ABQF26_21600, partial [Mycolicibacterium elephantis]
GSSWESFANLRICDPFGRRGSAAVADLRQNFDEKSRREVSISLDARTGHDENLKETSRWRVT